MCIRDSLSNCSNSGIDVVGVLTQYQPLELNSYIGNGMPWDLDRLTGGVFVLPPYMKGKSGTWYKGTANAIYQNMTFIQQYLSLIHISTAATTRWSPWSPRSGSCG